MRASFQASALNIPEIDFSRISHSLENPMEQESKALINAGKAALHQLAQNFALTAHNNDSQE
jgi:hypothetical protein